MEFLSFRDYGLGMVCVLITYRKIILIIGPELINNVSMEAEPNPALIIIEGNQSSNSF